jgi:PAS domain-containing protein
VSYSSPHSEGVRITRAYAIAVLSVFVAQVIAHWPAIHLENAPVALSFCAIIVSAWFGGAGPGCLAIVLSSLGYYYSLLPPVDSFAAKPGQMPRFVADILSSVLVGAVSVAQRRATDSLRRTRDDLRRKVQELEKTNEAFRTSEAYLAEAQTLSHTGSFGWDPSSGELLWSEESFRIFEYDRARKPTIQMVLDRVHPDDVHIVQDALAGASQNSRDVDLEHRLLMPDGSVKHLHVLFLEMPPGHTLTDLARENLSGVNSVPVEASVLPRVLRLAQEAERDDA